jgi:glycosyltransferase involved in cell wall biosynthesis
VDQPRNAQLFDSWGAKVLILERPPKAISSDRLKYIDDPNRFSVTVINTFAPDEPLDPIYGAARRYPDVPFYILGDTSQAENGLLNIAPQNIVFTGYLHGEDYWNRLYSSRAVIALTTAEYSLLSGAIEAMALGKPPILSRRQALTEYFSKGTVFVDHTAESIVVGISELQQNEDRLIEEISELNIEKQHRWEAVVEELMTLIKGETCKEASMLGG